MTNDLGLRRSALTLLGGDYSRTREPISIFAYQAPKDDPAVSKFKKIGAGINYNDKVKSINDAMEWSGLGYRVPAGAKLFEFRGADYTVFKVESGAEIFLVFRGGFV